jgi:hypothetical protein
LEKLTTVTDTFQVSGWGLVATPSPFVGSYDGPTERRVELRKPDGSAQEAIVQVQYVFPKPTPKVPIWELIFRDLEKDDVPIGTEIWG